MHFLLNLFAIPSICIATNKQSVSVNRSFLLCAYLAVYGDWVRRDELLVLFWPDAREANIDVTSYYDYRDFIDPNDTVKQVCTKLAGHYGLGHIKDIALKDGFHLNAGLAPLGSSPTNWANVLKLMEPHMPDDSWLILEHVLSPEEARNSVAYLRNAAEQAGVTLS